MKIRIGTFGSRIAIRAAKSVALGIVKQFPDIETEIMHIDGTREAEFIERPAERIQGGNIYTDLMEQALLKGEIDIAVQSAKHLPLTLTAGTCVTTVLERGSPRDVLVTKRGAAIPENPKIGTNSLRRTAGMKKLNPGITVAAIEGNVDVRLRQLYDGDYDAIILSEDGVRRSGVVVDARFDFATISWQTIVPSACQGLIAVQSREGEFPHILGAINDEDTYRCFETERRAAELLYSDEMGAAGAYAYISNGIITLTVTKDQNKIITDSAPVTLRFSLAEQLAAMA